MGWGSKRRRNGAVDSVARSGTINSMSYSISPWILPEVDSHGAWAAVERARHAISDVPFEGIGHLTISIGVGLRTELEDSAALYERADQSLYRAKRDGRNRSIMWRPI